MNHYCPTILICILGSLQISCSTASFLERSPRSRTQDYSEWRSHALQSRDLILGMEMNDVRDSWGPPGQIEIAGDPDRGDQRWLYFTSPSKRWGLSQARIVYFEEGRVSGWETGVANP